MTVKELIEELSKLDPDMECFTLDKDTHWCKITNIWIDQDDGYAYFGLCSLWPNESRRRRIDLDYAHYGLTRVEEGE